MSNVKQIGKIGVKAGLCWIGDPSNILHTQLPKTIGRNWREFQSSLQGATTKQFDYDIGHPGFGMVVSTGHCDGIYPVYAEFDAQGHVRKVCIEFIREDAVSEPSELESIGHPLNFYDSLLPSDG